MIVVRNSLQSSDSPLLFPSVFRSGLNELAVTTNLPVRWSARRFYRGAVHEPVKVDGGDGAVFQVVTFAAISVTVFENALHHELVEATVTHYAVRVLFQISLLMGGKIN